MDNKKNGIPKLRFPGFTGAWEQWKLNEFLKTSKLKNENNKFTKKDVLSVSGDYGIVNQIKFKGRSFAGASVQKYRIVNTNDVVYTKSPLKNNPYGIIKANKGKPGIVSTLYAVYKTNEKVNASFVEYYFENDYRLNTYLKPLVNKGAKNDMKVSDDNALIGNVIFPLEYSEQIKIVKFLNRFDSLITLHQRKLEHLQEQKKGLLQKMFPKNGENVPEVRFPGFTDAWEQRKLSSMTQYKNGKGHEDKQTDSGDFELVNLNSISIDGGFKHSGKFINESDDGILYKNDLVMILSDVGHGDLLGRVALIPDDNKFILNQRVALLRPNKTVNPEFLFFYINSHQKYFKSQGAGMSQLNISKKSVETFSSLVPNIDEQKKISLFLMKLDSLIALHQRKLEHLELMKKGLLQQMFV